jgi:CMP-N-acetylneuraminic acid synthetase
MNILAIIPARGGSKRLHKKNIFPIWGRPMLYWAIEACRKSKYDIQVCVSTDSEEVSSIAKDFDAIIHKRPETLANDKAPKQAAIRSAASWYQDKHGKQDIFISLQPNSPEIKPDQLNQAIETLLKYKRDEIFSVDKDLMQNAALRIFKGNYVFQEDLSTNCGVIVCPVRDVHNIEDVQALENER